MYVKGEKTEAKEHLLNPNGKMFIDKLSTTKFIGYETYPPFNNQQDFQF